MDIDELSAEVAHSNFGDERLNRRLKGIVTGLAKDPHLSLPRAFDGAGLEAAYRFFSNQRVTPSEILSGHYEATRARCDEQGDFLIAHDSRGYEKLETLTQGWRAAKLQPSSDQR